MALPFSPFVAVLMGAILFLDFKWDKYMLLRFCGKSNKPFKAGGGVGFMVYYTIALFVFMMIWTGMWLSHPPMTDCADVAFGPYAGGENSDRPISLLQDTLELDPAGKGETVYVKIGRTTLSFRVCKTRNSMERVRRHLPANPFASS